MKWSTALAFFMFAAALAAAALAVYAVVMLLLTLAREHRPDLASPPRLGIAAGPPGDEPECSGRWGVLFSDPGEPPVELSLPDERTRSSPSIPGSLRLLLAEEVSLSVWGNAEDFGPMGLKLFSIAEG